MRRWLLVVCVMAYGLLDATVAAVAQPDPTTEPVVAEPDEPRLTILPRPNSGRSPENPGDPGGWKQLLLLAIICVALVAIVGLVRRDVRRRRVTNPG